MHLDASKGAKPPPAWANASRFLDAPFAVNVSSTENSLRFRVFLDRIIVEVFADGVAITQVVAPSENSQVGLFLDCRSGAGDQHAAPRFEASAWALRPAPVRTLLKTDDALPSDNGTSDMTCRVVRVAGCWRRIASVAR